MPPEDPTLIDKRGRCGGLIKPGCPGAREMPDGRLAVKVSTTARNVDNSGDWVDDAHVTRCPVAMVNYDPHTTLVLRAALWTEGGGSLSDIVDAPTAGLLAGVQALRAEFSTLKRKSQEAELARSKAEASSR